MSKTQNAESTQPMDHQPTGEKRTSERVISNRLRLAGIFAAAIATAGAFMTHDSGEGKAVAETSVSESATQLSDYQKKVQLEIEANPTIRQATIVLHEGVNLRSEPQMQNGTGAGDVGNVIATVGAGDVAVLKYPVVYTNHANEEFLSGRDAKGNYLWVNVQQLLADEQVSGKNYVDIVNNPQIIEPTISASFANGQFYSENLPGRELATVSVVPESSVQEQLK